MADHDRPAEYDAEIEVCGEIWFFARTLLLTRRLEQRFGPLASMMRRFEVFDVAQETCVAFAAELLRGCEDAPDRAAIARWVFEEGTPKVCGPMAKICGELFVGNRHLREAEAQRLAAKEGTARNPR